jgi:hypothetical protein
MKQANCEVRNTKIGPCATRALPRLGCCQIQGLFWGPLGPAACRLSVLGPQKIPLGRQNRRQVRSSRHVLIERKAKSNAGGLHLLLTVKWPGATPAILLLQLLLN